MTPDPRSENTPEGVFTVRKVCQQINRGFPDPPSCQQSPSPTKISMISRDKQFFNNMRESSQMHVMTRLNTFISWVTFCFNFLPFAHFWDSETNPWLRFDLTPDGQELANVRIWAVELYM